MQKIWGDVRYSAVFKVNGKPMRFLIDSGANSTDIDAKLATAAGVRVNNSSQVVTRGALGREVRSKRGVASLQIGPMLSQHFPFTVAPSDGRKTSTSSYAGQIGLDALASTGTIIDIPTGSLWVPNVDSPRNGRSFPFARGPQEGLGEQILGLGNAGRLPHLILRGEMQGKLLTWVVDTGAEVSVLSAKSFSRFNLPSQETNSRMIDASGDRVPLRRAQLRDLTFGNVTVTVFDIAVAPLGTVRQYFRDSRGRPVDGILGMDFLTNGQALLDSGSGILYLGQPTR